MTSNDNNKKRYLGFDDCHVDERCMREQIFKVLRETSMTFEQPWFPDELLSDEIIAEMNKKIKKIFEDDKTQKKIREEAMKLERQNEHNTY